MVRRGDPGWRRACLGLALCGCLVSASAVAEEPNPVLEITPGAASAFRAAVQLFAQPRPAAAAETPSADPATPLRAAPDPQTVQVLREAIEAGLGFSSVVLPLAREAFLAPGVTESIRGGPRAECPAWRQSGADAWVEGEVRARGGLVTVAFQVWDSARCLRLLGESVDGSPLDLQRLGQHIADRVVASLTGTPGVSATEIAFVSTRRGAPEIFVMDADGERQRSATRSGSLKSFPAWLPRGGALLYTAFQKNGVPALFLTSRGGVRPGPFLRRVLKGRPKYRGVFSPAGDRVAVVSSLDGEAEIFLVDPDGSDLARFTNSRSIEVSPSWSPDATRIAFVSDRSGSPQIYVAETNGANLHRITFQGGYNTSPAWSPDGRWIAYETRVGGQIDIWMVDPTGEVNVPLVAHPRNDENPTWSPDGRKLAFSSNRRGRADIYRVDLDGRGLVRMTSNAGENTQPAWSPFPRVEPSR